MSCMWTEEIYIYSMRYILVSVLHNWNMVIDTLHFFISFDIPNQQIATIYMSCFTRIRYKIIQLCTELGSTGYFQIHSKDSHFNTT